MLPLLFTALRDFRIGRFNRILKSTIMHRDVRFKAFTAVTMKNIVFWDVGGGGGGGLGGWGGCYRLCVQGGVILVGRTHKVRGGE
jgi:hypothetical protein